MRYRIMPDPKAVPELPSAWRRTVWKFTFCWILMSGLHALIYTFVLLLIALDSIAGNATQRRMIVSEGKETLQVWQRLVEEMREEF